MTYYLKNLSEDSGTTPEGHEYSIKHTGFRKWVMSFLKNGSNKPITREYSTKEDARNALSLIFKNINEETTQQLNERFRFLARIGRAAAALRAKNAQKRKQKEEEEKKKKRKHLEDDELESMEDARDAMDKQKEDEEDEKEMKNLREMGFVPYGTPEWYKEQARIDHEKDVKAHREHFGDKIVREEDRSTDTHHITRIHLKKEHSAGPYIDIKTAKPHDPFRRLEMTYEAHTPKIKTPKVTNLYEAYAKVYAKDKLGLDLNERFETSSELNEGIMYNYWDTTTNQEMVKKDRPLLEKMKKELRKKFGKQWDLLSDTKHHLKQDITQHFKGGYFTTKPPHFLHHTGENFQLRNKNDPDNVILLYHSLETKYHPNGEVFERKYSIDHDMLILHPPFEHLSNKNKDLHPQLEDIVSKANNSGSLNESRFFSEKKKF